MRHEANIPNHDRASVSEALEAALLCAAFQRMEESEMKQLYSDIRNSGKLPQAPADLRRRLNRRRGWAGFKRGLPRVAQAAAVFIAVLSIGTGIALATSPQARQWAAGALQSRVVDPEGFFGEVRSIVTDGAAANGRLMLVEDNTNISVYTGTDAKPTVYEWRNAGNRCIDALAVDDQSAWVLYHDYTGEPIDAFDLSRMLENYGLGRVMLGEDGAFDVAELASVPATAILDPEGRRLNSYGISGMALAEGKLVFAAEYALESELEGFSFEPANVRLFSWDTADGKLAELGLSGIPLDWSPEVFGSVYIAAYDDGASEARIYRLEGDALAEVCRVPYSGVERPNGFALRESDGALLYVLDGSVWMAPDMEPSRAVRVAVCGEVNGRGLLLDGDTYAVVKGDSVQVFDLTAPLGELDELVVDGDSWNDVVNRRFIAEHPDIAVVRDPGDAMGEAYADLMLAGRASGDVVSLDHEDFRKVRDAGLIAPLTDPALIAEWEKLPAGLRDFLSVDDRAAAIPMDFYAYSDVTFPEKNWDVVRGDLAEPPETWLDYLGWLKEFSHSDAAGKYIIDFERLERVDLDTPEQFEMYTLWNMAGAFARCWEALGEGIDFDRPEFTDCVDALAEVDWGAIRYADNDEGGEDRRVVTFINCYDPLRSEDDWGAGCRTLKIRPDAPRISRASGTFAFVPASSTSRATAQEYLKTLVAENHAASEGNLSAAAACDFTTDPRVIAEEAGMGYTADSIGRYRAQVGDVAFRVEPDTGTILAVRDAVIQFVSGQADSRELCARLETLYK